MLLDVLVCGVIFIVVGIVILALWRFYTKECKHSDVLFDVIHLNGSGYHFDEDWNENRYCPYELTIAKYRCIACTRIRTQRIFGHYTKEQLNEVY